MIKNVYLSEKSSSLNYCQNKKLFFPNCQASEKKQQQQIIDASLANYI